MKYVVIVIATLCLGVVTLFSLNSPKPAIADTNPVEGSGTSPATEANATQATIADAILAHYTFDAADGAVVHDHAVYNNGVANGKYWRSAGIRNNALVLEDGQVEIANQPQLNHDLSPFSISTWVQLRPDSSIWIDKRDFQNRPKTVEGRQGGTFDHYVPLAGYSLWVSEHATDGTFINLFVNQMGIEFNANAHFPAGQSLANGQWHHVVATVTPGQAGGLVLYVNGAAVAWADTTSLTQPYNSTSPMYIYGRGQAGVDETALFGDALSAEQVAELFNE